MKDLDKTILYEILHFVQNDMLKLEKKMLRFTQHDREDIQVAEWHPAWQGGRSNGRMAPSMTGWDSGWQGRTQHDREGRSG